MRSGFLFLLAMELRQPIIVPFPSTSTEPPSLIISTFTTSRPKSAAIRVGILLHFLNFALPPQALKPQSSIIIFPWLSFTKIGPLSLIQTSSVGWTKN